MTNIPHPGSSLTPSEFDIARALATVGRIKHLSTAENPVEFHAEVDGENIRLPKAVRQLFLSILNEIADGHAVQVIAHERELTSQEAADILKVSRPYLVRLLDEERIPSHRVGTHRRVLYKDIKDYSAKRWSRRKATLDKLSALDQELGLDE